MPPAANPLQVLIRTAVPADGDRLVLQLRECGFEPQAVMAGAQAPLQTLLDPTPDLILAEIPGPGDPQPYGWVAEVLELQKQSGLQIPLIVIADPAWETQAAAYLAEGAVDYLCKDRLQRLGAAVKRAVFPRIDKIRREEEARYQLLFEHAGDIFLFVRLEDGRILDANRAAERAYGYSRTELLGLHINDLRAPETLALLDAQMDQVRAGAEKNSGVVFETAHRRKDGSAFPVEVSVQGLSIEGEQISLSIIHDLTQQKEAGQMLERRMVELEVLSEVAQAGTEATSLDELIRRVVVTVRQRLFPDRFGVALLDEIKGVLSFHPSAYMNLTVEPIIIPIEKGITGSVVRSGKPRREGDVRQCPEYIAINQPVHSELCVPLMVGSRVLGVLNAESYLPDYFNAADERLLVTVAGALATAIEKVRLLENEHHRLQELETLAGISRQQLERMTALRAIDQSILAAPDLERTLTILLENITRLMKVDAADILLYESRHQVLLVAAEHGMPPTPILPKKFAFENTHAGQVAMKRKIEFIPDLTQIDDGLTQRLNLIGAHFTSYLAVPLVAKDAVKGVVEIYQNERLEPTADWMEFLQALTDQAAIAIDNALLFKEQKQTTERLKEAYEDTIDGWSRVLDMRDKETEGHSRRVTDLTMKLARRLGLAPEHLAHIRRGAQLHDIGKMGIRDNILLKPGPLTPEEWEIMREHPLYALDFLYPIEFLGPALDIPYYHHEKWDGTGYPLKLHGEQIPLAARIFAVVDVWDALTSARPYRPPWSTDQALAYIREQTGIFFDPRIVAHFLAIIAEEGLAGAAAVETGAASLVKEPPADE